jgi:quercetin dioxygenase-like cupin family protein
MTTKMTESPGGAKGCYGKAATLETMVDYAADSVVSKTLVDKPVGTLTLFAFDAGQGLSEHTAPYDAVVQVVDGRAVVTIDGRDHAVQAGQMIIMPANVPHSLRAEERFKMLLTMIRSKENAKS